MDLSPFCGRDEFRPYLMKPFSRGGWTYATDGRILVRVPELPNVPDNEKAPAAQKLFEDHPDVGAEHMPLPKFEIPYPEQWEECSDCEGRGHEHDCPSCQCICRACDGTGNPIKGRGMSVGIKHISFDAPRLLLLSTLPNVRLTIPKDGFQSSHFLFDGGEGLLMPMVGSAPDHIVAEAA